MSALEGFGGPLVAAALLSSACAGGNTAPDVTLDAGSCAAELDFQGRTYYGHGVRVAAVPGRDLGSGSFPPCDDTNDAGAVDVAAFPGVDPDVVVLTPGDPTTVWVEESTDLPPKVARLTRDRTCTTSKPFELGGSWLGISPHVANDPRLRPPYQLEVQIDEASRDLRRYRGAFVHIDVTPQTRNPVTRHDIRTSLWKGGRLSAEVHCDDKAIVVDALRVHPGD